MTAHLSSLPVPASDAVSPSTALGPVHRLVNRRVHLGSFRNTPPSVAVNVLTQVHPAAQQGLSARVCVASLNERRARSRVHQGAPREYAGWSARIRTNIPATVFPMAGMETPGVVAESGQMHETPLAPKAIATLAGPFTVSQSSDQERAATGVSIAVIEANDARMKEVNHARLATFPNSKRETRENQGEPAEGRANPLVAKALLLSSRSSASPVSTVGRRAPIRLVTSEGKEMARPVPIFGQLETRGLDFRLWRKRALADEHIDQEEAIEGLQIANDLVRLSDAVIRSTRFAASALTCADGMDSTTVRRQFEERQAELIYLNEYRLDGGPEAA